MAQKWASEYPFHMAPGPRDDLPQIAQYAAVTWGDRAVRTDLRNFYEEQLARRYPDVSADSHDGDLDNLVGRVWEQSANENPLELHRLLAKFRCSIYLTTEVNSLLTRASKEAGRGARTEYCRWRQEHFEHVDFESPEHGLAVDDYRPTPGRPFRLTHVRNPE